MKKCPSSAINFKTSILISVLSNERICSSTESRKQERKYSGLMHICSTKLKTNTMPRPSPVYICAFFIVNVIIIDWVYVPFGMTTFNINMCCDFLYVCTSVCVCVFFFVCLSLFFWWLKLEPNCSIISCYQMWVRK